MKIERIKKSHKKEIIIGGLILVSIVSAVTLVTTRAKYRVTQSIKLVNGTVNYKVPDVRTIAVYLNDGNGDVETNNIPTSGYNLNSEKSVCKVYDGTTNLENAPKDNNINIEYKEGKINILGVSKKNTRCYLYFDKETSANETILANITIKDGTPIFANAATTDEGVFKTEDGLYGGFSYYWRGAVTNNYVNFANKCWRIIRINGDGTIRLIYDGTTCHANGESTTDSIAVTRQTYNYSENSSEYVGYTYTKNIQRTTQGTASNLKNQTDTWYNNIIGNNTKYSKYVADGKFCNDRNIESGHNWSSQPNSSFNYAAHKRAYADYKPTLECFEGDVYNLKVGAITMDEVLIAGSGKIFTSNRNYYLYNGQYYWTMTPSGWTSDQAVVFRVDVNGNLSDGGVSYDNVANNGFGIRPVINLRSDTTFSSGNGTQSNPYVVS